MFNAQRSSHELTLLDRQHRSLASGLICILMLMMSLSGCSIHKMTGNTMIDYTLDHLTPYILGTEDVGMACELGVSMGPFLMSFERVIDRPDQASVATMVTAALCAEQKAWDEELRALRAFKDQRVAEYKDARIAQKRAHGVAAHRYYLAYQRMVSR